MRLARGPFWLGSISKLTRSPPDSESKLTLESRPVRWKKYSLPSSAAMNPNPRSETNFLIVPVGIGQLLFSKASHERTGPFEKIRPRRTSPRLPEDESTLPPRFRALTQRARRLPPPRPRRRKSSVRPLLARAASTRPIRPRPRSRPPAPARSQRAVRG